METGRQHLSIGLIGVLIGGTLGAIFGVAVGATTNSAGTQTQIETVVRTQNLVKTKVLGTPTTSSTPTDTTTVPVDTVPPIVAPPVNTGTTTPAFTVPSTPSGPNQNNVQPPDPANPPADFCNTHVCGPTYAQGDGPAVECADGVWTRQGGQAVTCSADGGLGKASSGA